MLLTSSVATSNIYAQHPADVLHARLGEAVDPDEQAHFGLFPFTARSAFESATIHAEGPRLRIDVHAGSGRDTSFVLSEELSQSLARYVDEYELRFTQHGTPLLDQAVSALAIARVARPALLRTNRTVIVERMDGTAQVGELVFADADGVALLPPGRPYAWREVSASLTWIPLPAVLQVRQIGAQQRMLGAAQVIGAGGLFTAQALTAEEDGVRYHPSLVSILHPLSGLGIALLSAVTNSGPGRAKLPPQTQRIALFARSTPPEFRAWWAAREPFSHGGARETAYRPRLRVTLLDTWTPPGDVSYTQYATVDRPFQPAESYTLTRNTYVPSRQQRLTLDAEVRVWRGFALGGAYSWMREGTEELEDDFERIEGRRLMVGFVSTDLNRFVALPGWAAVSVGVGAARSQGRISGAVYGTRAFLDTAPDEGNIERYSFTTQKWHPALRVVIDLFGSRHLSFASRIAFIPGQQTEVPETSSAGGLSGRRWSNTQPAHTVTLSPWSVGAGLRLHL